MTVVLRGGGGGGGTPCTNNTTTTAASTTTEGTNQQQPGQSSVSAINNNQSNQVGSDIALQRTNNEKEENLSAINDKSGDTRQNENTPTSLALIHNEPELSQQRQPRDTNECPRELYESTLQDKTSKIEEFIAGYFDTQPDLLESIGLDCFGNESMIDEKEKMKSLMELGVPTSTSTSTSITTSTSMPASTSISTSTCASISASTSTSTSTHTSTPISELASTSISSPTTTTKITTTTTTPVAVPATNINNADTQSFNTDSKDVEPAGYELSGETDDESVSQALKTKKNNSAPKEECNNVLTTMKKRTKRLSNESVNISDETRISQFPIADLNKLDQMISWPRWIIPVLPDGHLEVLLRASIDLAARGLDTKCEPCQRFYRDGLTISFTRILTDEAVNGWKFEIHKCIFQNCERLLELIVLKLDQDCFPLLDLLTMVFNPNNKFHMFNMNRPESLSSNQSLYPGDEVIFARSPDSRCPRGWLVDLINRFGHLDGFQKLMERFEKGPPLTVPLIAALLKPFGFCYEFLTVETVKTYFLSIIESVPIFLESLNDEELKKESKNEAKNDVISGIVKSLKNLASRVPNQEERVRELEIFRLKMILRLLQVSSFNGKMNALNEVNKVIASVATNSFIRLGNKSETGSNETGEGTSGNIMQTDIAPYPGQTPPPSSITSTTAGDPVLSATANTDSQLNLIDEEDWLTASRMAQWIRENRVLQIVLKDSLHQPQYVEKLEKIIRFVIKEKALTLQDLDDLWAAQSGKHEAIVKNMHDLLAKLAWDFTPEQLDHLFECFRSSWTKASKKQREKLLELIRRLAEDDKDGVMANKVLNLFWNLAHSEDIPTDIMDQALAAHVKILDYSCCQDRDSQKTEWLDKCVEELKAEDSDWVLPALKLIREICCLLPEAPSNFTSSETQANPIWVPAGKSAGQSACSGATTSTTAAITTSISSSTAVTAATDSTISAKSSLTMSSFEEKVRSKLALSSFSGQTSSETSPSTTIDPPINESTATTKTVITTTTSPAVSTTNAVTTTSTSSEEPLGDTVNVQLNKRSVKRSFKRSAKTISSGYITNYLIEDFFRPPDPSSSTSSTSATTQQTDFSSILALHKKVHRQETPSTAENHGGVVYRHEVINRLHSQHSLVVLVSENLSNYMKKARQLAEKCANFNATTVLEGKRYSHIQEVMERLNFLRFLLKDGRLWLCAPQAKQVWKCLAESAIFPEDREACFRWFSTLMSEEQDLDPAMNRDFFENNILQLDPNLITESGIECFDRFFKAVNLKECKFIAKKHCFLTEDLELIGLDYLWRIVLSGSEEVANCGIALLKETYTNLGPSLEPQQVNIHHDLISSCMDRLQAAYDTVSVLRKDDTAQARVTYELTRMSRILRLLYEYVNQCDNDYGDERTILPLVKAVRGEQVSLTVRFPNQARHMEDIHIWTHRNEYISTIKKQILSMIKANNINMKIDLYLCDDNLENDTNREEKPITELPYRDEVVLNAKLYQALLNAPTSPDSSSDSSSGSPGNNYPTPSIDVENSLPGVILSKEHKYVKFFFQLLDLGMSLRHESLCDIAPSIITIIPPDVTIVDNLKSLCANCAENLADPSNSSKFDELFYGSSPTQILYSLGVIYALLMPSRNPLSEEARKFHFDFMKSGCGFKVVELLTRNNFVSSAVDIAKILVYSTVLRISELVLTCLGHYLILTSSSSSSWLSSSPLLVSSVKNIEDYLTTLRSALEIIPHPLSAGMVRQIAIKTAQKLVEYDDAHFHSLVIKSLPNFASVRSLMMLCWATVTGEESALHEDTEVLHRMVANGSIYRSDSLVYTVCKLALNNLTLMFMISPWILDQLIKDATWHHFVIDVLLICRERSIRLTAKEQFALIATKCALNNDVMINFINLLHHHLGTTVSVNGHFNTSEEFFHLFCKLLNNARNMGCPLPQAQELLESEIELLYNVRQNLVKNGIIEESLLEGHLGITRELIYLLKSVSKLEVDNLIQVGDNSTSFLSRNQRKLKKDLIRVLVDEYVFTASRAMVILLRSSQHNTSSSANSSKSNIINNTNVSQPITSPTSFFTSSSSDQSNFYIEEVNPICTTSATLNAAYDCLVALCTDCLPNLKYLADVLIEMYYSDNEQPLTDWEYQPPIGPRPTRGFVGLKNAGATCYMNSVFQQLYMIPEIRDGILSVEGAATDLNEDFSGEERMDNIISTMGYSGSSDDDSKRNAEESRQDYNLGVFKYTQAIFGHLAFSKLQYYVPRGFWRHFKLWGEPVNLREQHDALEFFNSLVDSIDEALKSLSYSPIMSKVLGGSFADQKICKECPHRYSREESFTTLNIDIRNHSNLLDSLEQYVKGDLLEGANAYHCEKCNRKVETVKRLCIKKLPTVLAIQLKRFDYDFDRSCAIKFNDYFEFPRVLDMEPYTVNGLAKIEGEIIEEDLVICEDPSSIGGGLSACTKYELCGIVVHSGQASGGHYYSYILHKNYDGTRKWYKFDDGDVTECKLDDDEEMKVQCFGGDYMGEVFDHMLKRMSCRRQKRWWNAYILFYRRLDTQENEMALRLNELTLMESKSNQNRIKMPAAIEKSVQRQNIKFMHIKNQFSPEYFQFMKKLLNSNGQVVITHYQRSDSIAMDSDVSDVQSSLMKIEAEEIAMICTQLASRFLFMTCFHSKKNLRGSALEWAEILNLHLRASPTVRAWFAHNVLFSNHYRFCEYLLDCPNNDVRSAFAKIIVFLAHFALCDGDCQVPIFTYGENSIVDAGTGLSDCLLQSILSLLNKEVSEHSRHLTQYFNLFYQYASIGSEERAQLLRLNVPATFMLVSLDEGPGPPIKYQYADFAKLYQVVSLLVRCCDASSKCVSYHNDKSPLPNPYGVEEDGAYLMPIQPPVYDYLYKRTFYIKKIIEDANSSEDTLQLLRFCSWENPAFSFNVLNELLWQIEYTYAYELRPHLDLIFHMLMIADSWQEARINNALSGLQDEREGLFDTIQRNKSHYQKRAYQCIKCLVTLFSNCPLALKLLHYTPELKKKWFAAVNWLNEELERRPYASINQYAYNWSPPAQSNETSNGYYLERSNSAKLTLSKAFELLPADEKDELEEQDILEENETSPNAEFDFPASTQVVQPSPSTATATTTETSFHPSDGMPTAPTAATTTTITTSSSPASASTSSTSASTSTKLYNMSDFRVSSSEALLFSFQKTNETRHEDSLNHSAQQIQQQNDQNLPNPRSRVRRYKAVLKNVGGELINYSTDVETLQETETNPNDTTATTITTITTTESSPTSSSAPTSGPTALTDESKAIAVKAFMKFVKSRFEEL